MKTVKIQIGNIDKTKGNSRSKNKHEQMAHNFEETKNNILKNKCDFILIQLQDLKSNEQKLININTSLKQQISQMKKKQELISMAELQTNRSGEAGNKVKPKMLRLENVEPVCMNSEGLCNSNIKNSMVGSERKKSEYSLGRDKENTVDNNRREDMIGKKEEYLLKLEEQVKEIKKRCIEKMKIIEEYKKQLGNICDNRTQSELPVETNYQSRSSKQKHHPTAHGHHNKSRDSKSISVNLSHGDFNKMLKFSGCNNSFNSREQSHRGSVMGDMQRRKSSSIYLIDQNRKSVGNKNGQKMQTSMNSSMNNSILNNSVMNSSKSYGKIVTKITCEQCGNSFKPNQYFNAHIDQQGQCIQSWRAYR